MISEKKEKKEVKLKLKLMRVVLRFAVVVRY